MDVSKIDAATAQIKTAIRLYFEDRDPISVHTLATAAGEIIALICKARGIASMRADFLSNIRPERQKEIIDALNKARNFFKHADQGDPNEILKDFTDDRNFIALIFVCNDLELLGIALPEARMFGAWVSIVEPQLKQGKIPADIRAIFGDIEKRPRAEQKKIGWDAIHYQIYGKLPD